MEEEKISSVRSTDEEEVVLVDGALAEPNVAASQEEVVVLEDAAEDADTVVMVTGKKKNSFAFNAYDFISVLMASFIIIAVCFSFIFRLVGVDGESMTNTLQNGDWLITVEKAQYEYGDIVVITQPNYFNKPLIKRVIARGGQTVRIDYDSSTVYVDDVALDEPYTREDFILPKYDDCDFPYVVPDGFLFCMGDNRNGSTDSRSNLVGPIDERYILGKAVYRIMPFTGADIYDYGEEQVENYEENK